MKITGIYKFENKINHHIYIGQSIDINRRYLDHLYDAHFRSERSTGVDLAIAKYGIDNFSFEILEECKPEQLNEREIYWIEYYNSYKEGYNRTPGGSSIHGEDHPRAILTEKQVWEIREMYAQKFSRKEAYLHFEDTGISPRGFKKVWDGETWPLIHADVYTDENRLWHKQNVGHSDDQVGLSPSDRTIKQAEIDQWVLDYHNGMSINAIAKKYDRDNGIVKKYINNPVAVKNVKYSGRIVKCLNTNQIFNSINSAAKWAHCGATTLTRHLATDNIAGKVPETGEPAKWVEIL